MNLTDFADKVVLITGGTKGIGRACGLAFAKLGAQVWLTHRWGSADEAELKAAFEAVGGKPPQIVEADASHTSVRSDRTKSSLRSETTRPWAHRMPGASGTRISAKRGGASWRRIRSARIAATIKGTQNGMLKKPTQNYGDIRTSCVLLL